MAAGYTLGSDTETISFGHGRLAYRPAGTAHAVDPTDPVNAHADPVAHDGCVAAPRAAAPGGPGPDESR